MICFVTGAANGIGKCVAQTLYDQGHSIVMTDIDLDKMRLYTSQQQWTMDRVLVEYLDVAQPQQWQQVIEKTLTRFGRIDVALNIAGVIRAAFITDLSPTDVDFMVDINLKGVMYGTKYMSDVMLHQGSGQIVNVASLAGIAPIVGLPIYSATKFGVRAFSIAVAHELRAKGVFVSVVCPDLVNTQMLTQQLDHEAANLTFSGERVLSVQEITRVILDRAIAQKQVEVLYPRYRGFLGKLGNFFPQLAPIIAKVLEKKGQKKRLELQQQTT